VASLLAKIEAIEKCRVMLNAPRGKGLYDDLSEEQFDSLEWAWTSMTRWFWYSLGLVGAGVLAGGAVNFLVGPDWNSSGWILIPELLVVGAVVCLFVALAMGGIFWRRHLKFSQRSAFRLYWDLLVSNWHAPYLPRIALGALLVVGIFMVIYVRNNSPAMYLFVLATAAVVARWIRSYL
jgi:hypothetical protein